MVRSKELWTGVLFLLFGCAGIVVGLTYEMGSLSRMGPGFFPVLVGGTLAVIGITSMVRAATSHRILERVEPFRLSGIVWITASLISFSLFVRPLGLIAAILALVITSAPAWRGRGLDEFLLIACSLTGIVVLIFVLGLGIPMKLLP